MNTVLTVHKKYIKRLAASSQRVPELGGVGVGGARHLVQQARQRAQRGRQARRAQRPQRARAAQHAHVQRDVPRHVQHCAHDTLLIITHTAPTQQEETTILIVIYRILSSSLLFLSLSIELCRFCNNNTNIIKSLKTPNSI